MPRTDYDVVIGLEVHCQVKTQSKMFCSCQAGFGHEPNTNTCPVCLGLPGALPVLNALAIEKTLLAGQILGCSTPPISKWDRKSYFYPDMPKNYQISQFDLPLCLGGAVPLYESAYPNDVQKQGSFSDKKSINLTRIHLEEDVAKSTHFANNSVIDFNRAGTPLMEIVSEPDMSSASEAYAFLRSLQQLMVYGEISDADMEKGQLRCDVNISIKPKGSITLGQKIELKNLNSFSAVRRAIDFEIRRQVEEIDAGIAQIQSTRRWDDSLGETSLMRTKEDAHDYRYFSCPDLVPIHTAPILEKVRQLVPELPHEKQARFIADYGVSPYDAGVLSSERALADYFEAAAKKSPLAKKIANWVLNNLLGSLNEMGLSIEQSPLTPAKAHELVALIEEGIVSSNQARDVFAELCKNPQLSAAQAAKSLGFEKTNSAELDAWIAQAISENPAKVAEIQAGNEKLLNWLTGQVMKLSKGKANPKLITDALREKLF